MMMNLGGKKPKNKDAAIFYCEQVGLDPYAHVADPQNETMAWVTTEQWRVICARMDDLDLMLSAMRITRAEELEK